MSQIFYIGSSTSVTGAYYHRVLRLEAARNLANGRRISIGGTRWPVGYFPYDVAVSDDGTQVFVSNWGVTAYQFANPTYGNADELLTIAPTGSNEPAGYFVAKTSVRGSNPKTSSVSIINVPEGDGASAALAGSVYQGHHLDALFHVGDTHPSATALVTGQHQRVLYVTRTNSDSLGLINVRPSNERGQDEQADGDVKDFDLSLLHVRGVDPAVHGLYPNALAVSPDQTRVYVAEAGINAVAVLDSTRGEIAARFDSSWPTISRHLAVLRDVGLVIAERKGQEIHYALNTSVFQDLVQYLMDWGNPVVGGRRRTLRRVTKEQGV